MICANLIKKIKVKKQSAEQDKNKSIDQSGKAELS
jgi:hypothetical protein